MKLSAEEYMDLCKRCWHSYIAFPAADFELAYANNVSPLDACTAIWSIHRKELSLTDPEAAPTQGADARPMAISDEDILDLFRNNARERMRTAHYDVTFEAALKIARILLATRDAAPSDDWTDDQITREWNKHIGSAQTHHEAIRTFGRAMLAASAPRGKTE